MPIQVEAAKQPTNEEEGEKVHVREISQLVEKMVEAMDMETE